MVTRPNYRLIYNQDCTNLLGVIKEPIKPQHVEKMVDEIADAGAEYSAEGRDAVCPGGL